MSFIQWDPIFSIGVDAIDRQHQQLFEIGDRFHGAWLNRADRILLCQIFAELLAYTGYHFADEERLMQELGYPGLARHRDYHAQLVDLVRQYSAQLQAGVPEVETRALGFIKMWLTAHVLGTDRDIGAYLRGPSGDRAVRPPRS